MAGCSTSYSLRSAVCDDHPALMRQPAKGSGDVKATAKSLALCSWVPASGRGKGVGVAGCTPAKPHPAVICAPPKGPNSACSTELASSSVSSSARAGRDAHEEWPKTLTGATMGTRKYAPEAGRTSGDFLMRGPRNIAKTSPRSGTPVPTGYRVAVSRRRDSVDDFGPAPDQTTSAKDVEFQRCGAACLSDLTNKIKQQGPPGAKTGTRQASRLLTRNSF